MGRPRVADMTKEQLSEYRIYMAEKKAESRKRAVAKGMCICCGQKREPERVKDKKTNCGKCSRYNTDLILSKRRVGIQILTMYSNSTTMREIARKLEVPLSQVSQVIRKGSVR